MDVLENGMFALANAMLTRKIHCVRSQVKFLLLIRLCAIKVAYPSLPFLSPPLSLLKCITQPSGRRRPNGKRTMHDDLYTDMKITV